MAKKKKNRSTQKVVKFADAGIITPPIKTASTESNTEYNKKSINMLSNDSNLCKCENSNASVSDSYEPKTWQAITKMYGDADTTEVWDSKNKNPIPVVKSKKRIKNKHTLKQEPEQNYDFGDDKSNLKYKHPEKNNIVKNSLISLYRKRNRRKRILNREDLKTNKQKQENDSNGKDKTMTVDSPATRFDVFNIRKPKVTSHQHHNGTGDACAGGPCTKPNYNKQGKANLAVEGKDKLKKEILNNKEDLSNSEKKPGNKNAFFKCSSEKIMTMWSRCKLARMLFNSHSSKSQTVAHGIKEEPLFEMKVDSVDMRVLNSSEVNEKIKNIKKTVRKRSCICASRGKSRKKNYSHNVCAKGICENALVSKTRFDCKCRRKNNIIECKDTNCDIKKYPKNFKKNYKFFKPSREDQRKPMMEVMLDRNNMRILNSNEMGDVFKKAKYYEICPTGICRAVSGDPETELKCKCIGKKIMPVGECTYETCARRKNKCKLSEICSRVFSKSDNWVDGNIRNQRYEKQKEQKYNLNTIISDTKNNRELVRIVRQPKQQRGLHANVCECNVKKPEAVKKKVESKKRAKRNKKPKKHKTCVSHKIKRTLSCRKQKPPNCKEYIIKCLKREQVQCEKRLKKKEKEFKKNEKMSAKENLKQKKIQEKNKALEESHWNFLTKFISGVLNIGIALITKVITMAFTILTNPIGSFVYVRERAKDPPGTINRLRGWLSRTWSNKTSVIAETVKQSHSMNVIADQIEDSAVYEALFANKGRTHAEKALYERKRRLRKRRIQKRYDQAMFGCRHMLLTTMRKTPCLWFYHICPDLYPQCLSLVGFMTNFCHIILYLIALVCWTPCILCFEGCRACLCCFFCTN